MGLAVFSLSNERAGPKDRKYDPSRSHYKKVSLLRDRLIPAVGSTPTIIFIPPSWRGPLGSRRPKKAIAFSGGCFLVGAPFGPRGSVAWVPLWAFRLRWVRACYAPTTPQQQHNNTTPTPTPYSTSTRSRLLYTPTFLSIPPTLQFELYHGYSGTCPRACLISYHESPSYSLHKKGE